MTAKAHVNLLIAGICLSAAVTAAAQPVATVEDLWFELGGGSRVSLTRPRFAEVYSSDLGGYAEGFAGPPQPGASLDTGNASKQPPGPAVASPHMPLTCTLNW